jgi:hypothetical protein
MLSRRLDCPNNKKNVSQNANRLVWKVLALEGNKLPKANLLTFKKMKILEKYFPIFKISRFNKMIIITKMRLYKTSQ